MLARSSFKSQQRKPTFAAMGLRDMQYHINTSDIHRSMPEDMVICNPVPGYPRSPATSHSGRASFRCDVQHVARV
jgi:hypothetical protein